MRADVVNRAEVESHQGAIVDSVKDAPLIAAILRAAAKGGYAFCVADAAEVLFELYAMKLDDRRRLAAKLMEQR
jgi:hypothetical protein